MDLSRPVVPVFLCGVLAMWAAPAAAQRPGAEIGRFEVPGMDFRPHGAWRDKVARIREDRTGLMASRSFGQLNAAAGVAGAFQVTGAFNVPVVLIRPLNKGMPFPVAQYQQALFTPTPGAIGRAYSLKTYYQELSNGLITMDGTAFDWVQLSQNDTYYEDGCNGVGVNNSCPNGGARFAEMLVEALDSISRRSDSATVWAAYDNDGPDGLPNSGDDDGFVDFVTFLQPEVDGACGTSNIWAHRFVMRGWNNGSPYQTRTPSANGGFIVVDDYTMQSAVGGDNACTTGQLMPVGTIAHETGHAFGLPDLYDTSNNGQGIGEWGLMGSGNYARPYSPARMSAWSLLQLGWINALPLSSSQTVTLDPVASNDAVYVVQASAGEYWILENRQAQESDTAMMNPAFSRVKGSGLLVWHIDQNKINAGAPANAVNVGAIQGVKLEQADGLGQLQATTGANRGDLGDPFPGSSARTRYSYSTTPASRFNTGAPAGFVLDNIVQQAPGGAMQFDFIAGDPTLVVEPDRAPLTVKVEGAAYASFEDIFPTGTMVNIAADSIQTVSGGRSRATFQSWSNGGPLTQVVTTSGAVDTLTAAFSVEHLVKVSHPGGGTVTASTGGGPVAGDLTAGAFVVENTPVTVTLTLGAGETFNGWTGDTVTANATVVLPMNRGYILTANVLATVTVATDDAVQDILGTPTLTAQQKTFLDQLGNTNGIYDLGDFLAFADRNGLNPAPVLQRLAGRKE